MVALASGMTRRELKQRVDLLRSALVEEGLGEAI
jgi:hypothetical protein